MPRLYARLRLSGQEPIVTFRGRQRADLAQQTKLIPTVPALDDLVVRNANQNDSSNSHASACRGRPQVGATVSALQQHAHHDLISLRNNILDDYLQVRESAPHVTEKRFEL